ncbi:thioredoxin family protein [Myroides odoratus]|uniref:thioredoxin family protein n=1 Tax=Myroides odoratus TaxID=256 RepID=UPI0039AEC4B4
MRGISIKFRFILGVAIIFWGLMNEVQAQEVTFSNLEQQMEANAKPIVVFLHTNWCTYCALMAKKTFANEAVLKAIEEKAYFISFDAETKKSIQFKGQEFIYKKKGIQAGVHQLAEVLTSQQAYPALVILNKNYEIIYQQYAYVGPKEMLQLLEAL